MTVRRDMHSERKRSYNVKKTVVSDIEVTDDCQNVPVKRRQISNKFQRMRLMGDRWRVEDILNVGCRMPYNRIMIVSDGRQHREGGRCYVNLCDDKIECCIGTGRYRYEFVDYFQRRMNT